MKTKIVGIPGYRMIGKEENFFGAGTNHLRFLMERVPRKGTKIIPRIIFPNEDFVEGLDMLYLTGGPDLMSDNYNRPPGLGNTSPDIFREYFFRTKLKKYIENKVPIFGVCLGCQMLNVALGGTLYQDISHPTSEGRGEGAHNVISMSTGKEFEVNSHHHQGIDELAPGLRLDCLYGLTEDRNHYELIESFTHETLPIAAVQWHPEEWFDDYSIKLIRDLLYDHKKESNSKAAEAPVAQ